MRENHCDFQKLPAEAFDATLVCAHCRGRIPPSAAVTFEGADYVWHFCGSDCLAVWCEKMLREPDEPKG